jgi:hypothetical protein
VEFHQEVHLTSSALEIQVREEFGTIAVISCPISSDIKQPTYLLPRINYLVMKSGQLHGYYRLSSAKFICGTVHTIKLRACENAALIKPTARSIYLGSGFSMDSLGW